MNGFTKDICVDVHDVDFNGVCRASALLRYIQSAAQQQLTDNGMSYDELRAMGKAFIISRIKIEFYDTVRAYDCLRATTFPCDSRGYSFVRCYALTRGEQIIAKAISVWALVDVESRSLVRVDDFSLPLKTLPPIDLDIGRFRVPTSIREVGEYRVRYGEIDQNNHMNNTTYPDLYATFLPMENRRIASISISYPNDAPANELLKVYLAEEDGCYYLRTVRSDGRVNTEAQITLTDI
ncbi:MAG: hypothetical protein IJY27_07335 [Clostridia bacterium]|nr:hypothetical protein [Clostridia bacterium]